MDHGLSGHDELYLFESFGNLLGQDTPIDGFMDDDIPLADFLLYGKSDNLLNCYVNHRD